MPGYALSLPQSLVGWIVQPRTPWKVKMANHRKTEDAFARDMKERRQAGLTRGQQKDRETHIKQGQEVGGDTSTRAMRRGTIGWQSEPRFGSAARTLWLRPRPSSRSAVATIPSLAVGSPVIISITSTRAIGVA